MDMRNFIGNTTPYLPSDYDEQIDNTLPMYRYFHLQTIALIESYKPKPDIWLDTGCGTGSMILDCIDSFPDTNFVLADPSEDMLRIAKQKLSDYSSRIQFLPAVSSQKLPDVSTEEIDVITAIQSHHYLSPEKRVKATKACYDILKNDGIFITFENIAPMTLKGIHIGKDMLAKYQLSCGRTKEQVEKQIDRFGKEYFPITIEEHLALYKSCGFKVVELFWFSYMQAGFYCIK